MRLVFVPVLYGQFIVYLYHGDECICEVGDFFSLSANSILEW